MKLHVYMNDRNFFYYIYLIMGPFYNYYMAYGV